MRGRRAGGSSSARSALRSADPGPSGAALPGADPSWSRQRCRLEATEVERVGNEWETARNHRESTQNHRTMSGHAWECLGLTGIAARKLEFLFLIEVHYAPSHSES